MKRCIMMFWFMAAACLFHVSEAGELLQDSQWVFRKLNGAEGTMQKLPDGSVEISKTNAAGVIFFYLPNHAPKIIPGREYTVELDFKILDPKTKGYLMVSMPGGKRTPYPVSPQIGPLQDFQKTSVSFTARPDEKTARIHYCQQTPGRAVIRSISIREEAASANLLQHKSIRWCVRKNENSSGRMEKEGTGFHIWKTGEQGYLAVIPERNLPIVPGRHYQVQMQVKRLNPSVSSMLMLSMPGGHRRPFPTVKMHASSGKTETVEYLFTAREDEQYLRPHLIVRGTGEIQLLEVQLKELTAAELKAIQEKKKISLRTFRENDLKKYWLPVRAARVKESSPFPEIEGGPNAGFRCSDLHWQADRIAAVEALFRIDGEGGYLRLDFTAEFQGKKYSSFVNASSFADGQWREFIFQVRENPVWQGTITALSLTWMMGNGRMAVRRVNALSDANVIPFAEDLTAGSMKKLDLLRPRGIYAFQWKKGKNPGAEFVFFDRNHQILQKMQIAPGQQSAELTVPEQTVTAAVGLKAAGSGFPVLKLKKLEQLDRPAAYWRGQWIWSHSGSGPDDAVLWFTKKIHLEKKPSEASFVISADDVFEVFINGSRCGTGHDWIHAEKINAEPYLRAGDNEVTVRVHNIQAWGGLLCELYAMVGGSPVYVVSDGSWRYCRGDKASGIPERIADPVVVLGAPPVAPWGTRVGYSYAGPVGRIRILKAGLESFTAEVLQAPVVKTDKLYFRIVSGDGTVKRIQGRIVPGTVSWKTGSRIDVSYRLPEELIPGGKVFLDEEFISIPDNASVGFPRTGKQADRGLAEASVIGVGKRPFFLIDGKKYSPFYFFLPETFSKKPASRDFLIRNGAASGASVFRFGISMDDFWPEENRFDFSGLDRCMEVISLNAPGMKVILGVKCGMPKWWMEKNPDDRTAYYGNRPIHPQKDRQALASKKYLRDAAAGIRALIRHIAKAPYSREIFGMGISEGWNSEWFWSYADARNKPARSGFSKADFDTFRSYLREKYQTEQALAKAWNQPGLTFQTITMPSPAEQDRGTVLTLLDPRKDRAKIDWFEFRNRAVAEAVSELCRVVKEETKGKMLAGAYYGYLIAFSNIYHRLQTVGHLGMERLTMSPYVDFVTGPSYYHWRYMGMGDSPMQPAEVFTARGKLVIVEQDLRTFSENSEYESFNGRLNTVEQSVSALNRAFGMAVARGIGTHWMEMYESWFREKVLLDLLAAQQKVYQGLPEVQGTTPVEICVVSDEKSAFYVKHNAGDGVHRGLIGQLMKNINQVAAPFRHVLKRDLLQDGFVPPHKFYIMTNLLMLTDSDRRALQERFVREKAAVLWLYAPGGFTEKVGPAVNNIRSLLGIGLTMEKKLTAPRMIWKDGDRTLTVKNPNVTGPWFYPVSGYHKILGRDSADRPVFVSWQRSESRQYFCTLTYLPPVILRKIARSAGVHLYNETAGDFLHIGNDVLFLHARTGGEKKILLPAGTCMEAVSGPMKGLFVSGQSWQGESGETYGFLIRRQKK